MIVWTRKRADVFLDTNVVLFLLSGDRAEADRAESIVRAGAVISVQVLNELAAVALRKLKMGWNEIEAVLDAVRATCVIEPLTVKTHDCGRQLARQHGFSLYGAMIVASAFDAGCTWLYTENMQHGLCVQWRLTLCNPFSPNSR